jgi:threonine dehydrogenase-like Zn-dependent dehydrogenase
MPNLMNAQVFYEKEKMIYEKIPVPKVTDTDVLVKVKNVGICGSDISYYYGMSPVGTPTGKGPLVLGHEFAGEVVEVGSVPKALGLFKPGDRVVVNPVQGCNACPDCAAGNSHMCAHSSVPGVTTNGAFAEYCVSKYTGLFKLPDAIGYAAGACIEPLACAVNGLNKLDIRPGQFVAVFGPGPIGIWMVELAKKAYGAGKVALIGTRDFRLEAGRKAGADFIFNDREKGSKHYVADLKKAIKEASGGKLADRLITPAGPDAALEAAVECGGNCSIIVQFGLPDGDGSFKIPSLSFHTMDKQIRSAWLAPGVWPQTISLVEQKQVSIEALITHRAPLQDTGKAIQDLKNRKGDPIKYVIEL